MSASLERPRPYVGVSGVTSPEIQGQLIDIANDVELASHGRLLALGVKAVHKTQYLDIENKYGADWYPIGAESFTGALRPSSDQEQTIAVAQAYLDIEHVENPSYRDEFTKRILQRGEPWLQGIQFDMLPWHNNTQMLEFLERIKEQSGVAIFLQCHQSAMEALGPRGVVRQLGHYATFIDYLLLDSSHGAGLRMDASRLDTFLDEAHSNTQLDGTSMAVAGGLDAKAVREDIPMLLDKYPNLSWDAEGRLHPISDAKRRPLNMKVTHDYLQASSDILSSHLPAQF